MIDKDDWRLTNQMNYLFKKKLLNIPYEPYRKGWDHDHCAFCSITIDASIGKAYCTTDKYHWICPECFGDFQDMFKWKVVEHGDILSGDVAGAKAQSEGKQI